MTPRACRRKVRLKASGVTSGHFLLRATRAGQRGEVPRKRKRVGDRKVKWILLRHPLPEEPPHTPQYYTLSYPGLISQATPRLRNSPKGEEGGIELQDL